MASSQKQNIYFLYYFWCILQGSQFVSDLGGTAGLWVGASVLTIIEVIDLLVQIVIFPCKRRGSNKDKKPPPPIYITRK